MVRSFVPACLLCFLFFAATGKGILTIKTSEQKQEVSKINNDNFFHSLGTDFYIQATSPFKMNERQSFKVLGGIVSIVGLITIDKQIDNMVSPLKSKYKWIEFASPRVTELGGTYGIMGAGLFAGCSYIFNDAKAKQTSRLLAEALITTTVWSRLGKLISSRQRPIDTYSVTVDHDAGGEWYGPFMPWTKAGRKNSGSNYDAFPSGHTTTAFAIATVFAKQYKDNPAVPVIAYSLASIVGISRMTEHEHWASDVLAGGMLGYLCANEICNHASTLLSSASKRKIAFQYYADYSKNTLFAGCCMQF